MRKRSLWLGFLFGLVLSPLAAQASYQLTEHQVTDSTFYETTPIIGHDGVSPLVVYTSFELLNTGLFDQSDIFYRRLDETGTPAGDPVQVTTSLTNDIFNDISGDYIVYTAYDDVSSLTGQIMLYQISTGQTRPLGDHGRVRDPKIDGNYVVWLQSWTISSVPSELILYDITTNVSMSLAGPVPQILHPAIGSRFVAWSSLDGDYDIEVFDFELNARYSLSVTAASNERYPTTSGDWVAWETRDASSPAGRIEAYNGRTGELRTIADNGATNRLPSLDNNLLTWESNLNGSFDIYLHRLEDSSTFPLTDLPSDQYLNDLFGDLVAYVDQRPCDTVIDMTLCNEDIYVTHFNERPVVLPGEDQTTTRGVPVTLDGSASYDPDGDEPLSYLWQVEFAPYGSVAQPADPTSPVTTFTPDLIGYYTITLTVTDAQGAHGGPEWVVISTVNAAPVADAGPDRVINTIGETVTFDGSQSYDPDGDLFTYSWALEQVPAGSVTALGDPTIATPSFYADVPGEYRARLTVTDIYGETGEDVVLASFNNVAPVADAGNSRSALVGETVTLDGTASYDPNDPAGIYPLDYQWSLVYAPDSSTAALTSSDSAIATLVPDVAGLYIVQLVVSDGELDSEPSSIQVQAITSETAASESVTIIEDVILTIDPGAFKNDKMKSALVNKLNAALNDIADGDYAAARDKLMHDILGKTDGCADGGAPDKNDWIRNCPDQALVYPLIIDAINLLESMSGG